ncbi:hypothetical protein KGQ71_01615 [Patescibacteria group bacterium]|nr:hypothetical protein [Patescibacteria group bacterium]
MYYYIFEPAREAKEYERTAQIKECLTNLGIAGEMATPSPGKTIDDLVHSAITKRYSTVVAVGGIEVINQVARALEPYDAVFGIIPLTDHPSITQLIGSADWKAAAEQLKKRRWHAVRLGLINNQLAFITPATVSLPPDMSYTLLTPEFSLEGQGGLISISPESQTQENAASFLVEARYDTAVQKPSLLSTFFKQRSPDNLNSRFSTDSIEVHTGDARPVVIANTEICSTPIICRPQEKPIKLIVARGSGLSSTGAA